MKLDFRTWIERSYDQHDVPERYYVVGNFSKYSPEVPEQLSKLELPGMSGVSGSEDIIKNFLGVAREMLLVMDGYHFEQLNNLSRVQYDNPEYLVSNNLNAFLRILAHNPDKIKDYEWSSIRTKLLSYIGQGAHNLSKDESLDDGFRRKCYEVFGGMKYDGGRHFPKLPKIKSTWDLAKWIKRGAAQDEYYWKIDLTLDEAQKIIVAAMKQLASIYGDEQEWRVKNKTTKIPQGSELYILAPPIDQKTWSAYVQKKLNSFEEYNIKHAAEAMSYIIQAINNHKLGRLYELKFIHHEPFDKMRYSITYEQIKSIAKDSPFLPPSTV